MTHVFMDIDIDECRSRPSSVGVVCGELVS